jgi:5'-3' exoribonuclease 1
MGIKHFFHWFKKQYPEHMHPLRQGEIMKFQVDNLLLDMNGIFHTAAQKIYEYGNFKPNPRFLRPRRPINKANAQKRLFAEVCQMVEQLVKIANPTSRLIMCVDGPAPAAKAVQQRSRRFRSAMESGPDTVFDSCSITPGTVFMDHLTKYIDWHIRRKINEDPEWRKIQIIFSNHNVEAEGEHKLINFVRKYGTKEESYCLYGMDADLLMLAMATHMPKFYVLREETYDPGVMFNCVDIGSIRNELIERMRWTNPKHHLNPEWVINDFIFMCFTVGNDFLPHLPSIEIIQQGIELMFDVYKETCATHGHLTHATAGGKIQFRPQAVGAFLDVLGQHEQINCELKLGVKESYSPDELMEACSKQLPDGTWEVDIDKYRRDYVTKHFPHMDEQTVCHQYLEGLQWVLSYYTRGVPSWKWYFPHLYAPPASLLAQHVDTFKFPTYTRTTPSTPFQQLLCVLPPKSANLLPKVLGDLLTDPDSPLRKYCPETFEIDITGVRRAWEGIAVLPMIDFDLFRDCYMKRISSIDQRDVKRNMLGKSFLYEYNPTFPPTTFGSYYGDIQNSYVRVKLIDI